MAAVASTRLTDLQVRNMEKSLWAAAFARELAMSRMDRDEVISQNNQVDSWTRKLLTAGAGGRTAEIITSARNAAARSGSGMGGSLRGDDDGSGTYPDVNISSGSPGGDVMGDNPVTWGPSKEKDNPDTTPKEGGIDKKWLIIGGLVLAGGAFLLLRRKPAAAVGGRRRRRRNNTNRSLGCFG